MNGVFQSLENSRKARGACALALIDPDVKNDLILADLVSRVADADFDAILVGGSLIMDNGFEDRISRIREDSKLPVIIFPGSSRQLSAKADAVLFLSLLSGRNPQYLIGEQVESAPIIHHIGLEAISTGYILLDGGVKSSVQVMSNTNPLPVEKEDIILAHALAGQYLGMKVIFLESGSGAQSVISQSLLTLLKSKLSIPVIAGGGITSAKFASDLVNAGADYLVIGNLLEKCDDRNKLIEITKAIHYRRSGN